MCTDYKVCLFDINDIQYMVCNIIVNVNTIICGLTQYKSYSWTNNTSNSKISRNVFRKYFL